MAMFATLLWRSLRLSHRNWIHPFAWYFAHRRWMAVGNGITSGVVAAMAGDLRGSARPGRLPQRGVPSLTSALVAALFVIRVRIAAACVGWPRRRPG
jgi:hypothetical protein